MSNIENLREELMTAINGVSVNTDDMINCDRVELQEFFNATLKATREAVTNALQKSEDGFMRRAKVHESVVNELLAMGNKAIDESHINTAVIYVTAMHRVINNAHESAHQAGLEAKALKLINAYRNALELKPCTWDAVEESDRKIWCEVAKKSREV